ncbi:Predicted ATPase (AAA+ superfamily) [hydrothermal vent metagenome]|uniref:Predicted ATPase (AAA+ superfamily) n=1 Tax=hydrothermal vent metagenome TaxID=652676 RepID=A0A3B1DSR2_9ZZZZ
MRRKITDNLLLWRNKLDRKPLLIDGARQVGKTYVISAFGRGNYDNVIYVNFETHLSIAADFDNDITPEYIINCLEVFYKQKILPGKTLIFFDEIQSCERALTSLKYFYEAASEYHIIAAGSLLGVAINRDKFSFPVGKVDRLHLYPMDFEEFLWAQESQLLAEKIRGCYISNEPLPDMLHQQALTLYKNYLIVGGMPAVINAYNIYHRLLDSADVQTLIVNSYIADMAKYAAPAQTTKIMSAFQSIPVQLAKENRKFQYKVIQKGGSSSMFGPSIDWLCAAGLVIKCHKVIQGKIPLAAYQDLSSFKLYMGDVGLLVLKSGMPAHNILTPIEINNTFFGAIAENYVACQLAVNGAHFYYWDSAYTAEIDFVIQDEDQVIPIEVKAGVHIRSRSLSVYREKYSPSYVIRVSAKNFGFENNIKSVPLYAVFCIKGKKE